MDTFICPKCKRKTSGFPALSRDDNRTSICSDCGTVEAMEDYFRYVYTGKETK